MEGMPHCVVSWRKRKKPLAEAKGVMWGALYNSAWRYGTRGSGDTRIEFQSLRYPCT